MARSAPFLRDQLRRSILRFSIASAVALAASGCSVFGNDDDKALEPLELVKIEETLDVQRLWSQKLGGGSELLRLGLSPAGDGNHIYAASYDGNVSAYNPDNGDLIWRVKTELTLSSGPGVGEGLVVVCSADGDVLALHSKDGSEAWRVNVAGESLARPLVGSGVIVVYTIDGQLRVLSALDGVERWVMLQAVPALTQRGSSSPILVGSTIVVGFDNGRLIAVDLNDGIVEWEAVLTPPSGRSDLDRLADVDGGLAVVGQDVYAAGFNGQLVALAVESGQVLWSRDTSSPAGVASDWNNVYTVGNAGEIIAVLRRNGDDVWRQESLLRREPTAPVPFSTAIVVGDFEGYVHFFSNFDGRPVARERAGKGMISGVPVAMGDKLFVQNEQGTLTAFTVRLPKGGAEPANADAKKADEES
jgi:outer membrane protein assembly factor BamB